jgi:drug/metabolite transporter (DMT)-like permease
MALREQRIGQGAVLLCAIFWSTSGLFIKLIDWHPMIIAGTRSLIAALFMVLLRIAGSRRKAFVRQKLNIKNVQFWGGGIAYSATMLLFCSANKLTTSANAIMIQYSAPIWAALLGWALAKEKPARANWFSLGMVIAGLCLFFKDGWYGSQEGVSFSGNALALASGICFGANSVFMRTQKEGDPADSMILAHILTALASIPFFFVAPPVINPGNTGAIFFMGIVQIGMASLLFAYGIKRVTAVKAMLTAAVEPILNPVWVLLVTGERPTLTAVLGGIIIIVAVLVSSLG